MAFYKLDVCLLVNNGRGYFRCLCEMIWQEPYNCFVGLGCAKALRRPERARVLLGREPSTDDAAGE